METRAWTPKEHPRLFFSKGDLENLRDKRNADDIARAAWIRIKEETRIGMAMELPRESSRWEWDTGSDNQLNLGAIATSCVRAVSCLSLSWLMDGNESHARKATDILMTLCDFDFWTSLRFFGTDYRLPWRGTLETGFLCQCACLGYDWLFNYMNEAERHRLRTCMLYKGILPLVQDWADPYTRLPLVSHIKPWGNWWQNCIAPAGEAAMSIYGEHPLAARFAGLCKEASDWFFSFEGAAVPDIRKDLMCGWKPGTYYPSNFDSEGASWEGLNYMDEVLLNSIRFAESYRRQTGEEILPLETMKKVAEFILNGSFRQGDRMRAVNFGDSRAGAATIPGVTAYLARRLKHPGMQWFLHNCQNNFNENAIFKYETIPVFDFLWYDPDISPCEPEKVQTMKIYPGMGCAVMRNGWGHESSMLAFRCGSTGGHAHPDAGSFVLYSRDKMLLIDSGCCGYEMPEQSEYYQTTRAHNTILVGDEGQIKRLDGKLVDEISQPELSFVLGDAAAPYEGRLSQFLRGVLFVGREYYVIIDWLNKQTDKPYQWLLHYDGEMIRKTKGYFIKNERANLLVKIIEPSEYNMKIRQGYKTYNEDLTTSKSTEEKQKELESGDYMEITPVHNMNQQKFLTILYPFGKNGNAPKIEKMEAENWVGIRVDRNHEVDIIGLNMDVMKDGGGLTGIKADAELFCITFNKYGIPIRAFMKTGTYLKYEGNLLASSPEPATIAVEV